MKTRFVFLVLCFLIGAGLPGSDYRSRLTPLPQQIGTSWESFALGPSSWRVEVLSGGELLQLGKETLEGRLRKASQGSAGAVEPLVIYALEAEDWQKLPAEVSKALPENMSQTLGSQGYAIKAIGHAVVVIGKDRRGAYYGMMTLAQLAEGGVLPVTDIVDYPEWKERYFGDFVYGTFEDYRKLSEAKINGFTFQQQHEWYLFEPSELKAEFAAIRHASEIGMMDFMISIHMYSLSWGVDRRTAKYFNASDPGDMNRLIGKLRAAAQCGVRHFMICYDDWTPLVEGRYTCPNPAERSYFHDSAGAAHAYAMNRLYEALHPEFPDLELSICPPPYSLAHIRIYPKSVEYFRDLHRDLNPAIAIVWTGPDGIIPQVDKASFDQYSSMVSGHTLFQWNNSDCLLPEMPTWIDKFYPGFQSDSKGMIFINLHTMSWMRDWTYARQSNDYLWNPAGYDGERSYDAAVIQLWGESAIAPMRGFRDAMVALHNANAQNDVSAMKELLSQLQVRDQALKDIGIDYHELQGYYDLLRQMATRVNPEVVFPISAAPADLNALTPEFLSKCAQIPMGRNLGSGSGPLWRTVVHGGIFADQLLLVFDMESPGLSKLQKPVQDVRDNEIYSNPELIEIFLLPRAFGEYIHFSFDVFGDQAFETGEGFNRDHRPQFTVKIERQENAWRAVVLIPVTELEIVNQVPPTAANSWRINLFRTPPAPAAKAAFSPLNDMYSAHTPQTFGVMKFKESHE